MRSGFHRRCLLLADRFFPQLGGAASYILGNESLLWQMAQSWEMLSAALGLPEYHPAMSTRDYYDIQVMKAGGKSE